MDAASAQQTPAQNPTTTTTNGPPQIRSRITVVCAECKRLKLKCDRRTPCGSCTKRDTVARCIYSPAAAEKVDLHSLNNRLIQVEAQLALLSSQQSPSPSSQQQQQQHQPSHHHHHHHHRHLPADHPAISLSLQDVCSMWLDDLDLSLTHVKLEQQLPTSNPFAPTILIDIDQPNALDASRQTALILPPLTIYYPVPQISPPHPSASPFPILTSSLSPNINVNRPQVTPALRALLPSLQTCKRLLHYAGRVFAVRPVPFSTESSGTRRGQRGGNINPTNLSTGWTAFESRCLDVLDLDRDRDRDREEKRRARAIYFGAASSNSTSNTNSGGGDDQQVGLGFFALMCAVLAVGAAAAESVNPPGNLNVNSNLTGNANGTNPSRRSTSRLSSSSTPSTPNHTSSSSETAVPPPPPSSSSSYSTPSTSSSSISSIMSSTPMPMPVPVPMPMSNLTPGLLNSPNNNKGPAFESPVFLYALAQQAMGVWEAHAAGGGGGAFGSSSVSGVGSSSVSGFGSSSVSGFGSSSVSGVGGSVSCSSLGGVGGMSGRDDDVYSNRDVNGNSGSVNRTAEDGMDGGDDMMFEDFDSGFDIGGGGDAMVGVFDGSRASFDGSRTSFDTGSARASFGDRTAFGDGSVRTSFDAGSARTSFDTGSARASFDANSSRTSFDASNSRTPFENRPFDANTRYANPNNVNGATQRDRERDEVRRNREEIQRGREETLRGRGREGTQRSREETQRSREETQRSREETQRGRGRGETQRDRGETQRNREETQRNREETQRDREEAQRDREETERLDYLRACIVCVEYLLVTAGGVGGLTTGGGGIGVGGVGGGIGSGVGGGGGMGGVGGGDMEDKERSEKEKEKERNMGMVFPLVGKMVNVARAMGLGKRPGRRARDVPESMPLKDLGDSRESVVRDSRESVVRDSRESVMRDSRESVMRDSREPMTRDSMIMSIKDARDPTRRYNNNVADKKAREDVRRMLWWDVVYYDLFTSDLLGHPSLIPPLSYSTPLPACSASYSAEDMDESDDEGDYPAQLPVSPVQSPQDRDMERYFGVRCRLTQLTQTIKHRIANPECCCGYTLEQAMALEADVRRWVANLPSALRLPPNLGEGMSPFIDVNNNSGVGGGNTMMVGPEHSVLQMQTCELAIMAQLLILRIYTPFVRNAQAQANNNTNANTNSNTTTNSHYPPSYSTTSHANTAILTAAQNIMRASKILHVVLRSSGTSVLALPPMLDFFPLEKVVFDATVICAHAGLSVGSGVNGSSSNSNGNANGNGSNGLSNGGECAVLDDANLGLDLLFFMNRWGAGEGEVKRKIAEALKHRVTARAGGGGQGNGLKRKHDQLELGGGKDPLSSIIMNVVQEPFAFEMPGYNNNTNTNNSGSGNIINSTPTGGLGPQPESINILPILPMPVPQQEVIRPSGGTGEKDAKQAKKVPPVGIRIRSTKEAADGVVARARATSGDRERIQEAHSRMPAPRPLMTTVPRPLVPEFTQQYRSRSSSISMQASEVPLPQQQQQQQQPPPPAPAPTSSTASIDYSMAFGEQMSRFGVVDMPSQQHSAPLAAPQLSPTHPAFGASSSTFDPAQTNFEMSRAFEQHRGSFDQGRTVFDQPPRGSSFDQHRGSFDQQSAHSGESSSTFGPLSSPPLPPSTSISSANSPFGSSGGHLTTPTYTASVHHPSPPVFGQPNSSPTNYFNPPMTSSGGGYDSQFDTHGVNHGNTMMSSVPSTPMYEKHHFDLKPPDGGHTHHTHHMPQTSYNDQNIQPHHSIAMGPPQQTATWTPPPQQPLITVQPGQQYWTTNEFKFYD